MPQAKRDNIQFKNITNVLEANTIQLYGVIGRWEEIDWTPFQNAFRPMDYIGNTITILVNCYGGSTFAGLSIFDLVKNAKAEVIIINEGLAASMGGVLLQATKKENRKATKNSRVMVHKVSGCCCGDADDMKDFAQQCEDEEAKIVQVFVESTGQKESVVKSWMQHGVDKWFSAEQALAAGLIGEIIEPTGTNNIFPDNNYEGKSHEEILNIYNTFQNQNPKNNMNKFKFAIAAILMQNGITAPAESESDEKWCEALNNAFVANGNKVTEAQNKLNALGKTMATQLIENAITAGKLPANIEAAKKEGLINNATSNYDLVSNMLNMMPSTTPAAAPAANATNINQLLNTAANGGTAPAATPVNGIPADRQLWNLTEWAKKDPEGLKNLAKVNPAAHQALLDRVETNLIENGFKNLD
jgi:ATP-dependent Clp endopeptidase proteolytic subunit ClpP